MSSDSTPSKASRRHVPLGVVLICCLILVAGGYLGFRVYLKHYLRSDAFLSTINRATSRALQVDGRFETLDWLDAKASSPRFSGSGYSHSSIQKIDAGGMEATLNFRSIWDGVWEITELSIEQANVEFKNSADSGKLANEVAVTMPNTLENNGKSSSILSSLLPQRTQLKSIKIESANIDFPVPSSTAENGQTVANARRLRINARPLGDHFSEGWQLSGYGGEMRLPDNRQLSLLDYNTRWKNGTLHIADAVADVKDSIGARVRCRGRLDTSGQDTELQLNLSGIDIEEVVAPDWKQHISGNIESDLTYSKSGKVTSVEGDLSITRGVLNALPILDHLADYTKHDTFRRLPLSKATATFTKDGDTIQFRDIFIESSGTLRITGILDVTSGISSGHLRVGVVPGVLRWIPGAEQKVFTQLEDGHLWTDMKVHGPLHALNEDLSSRLVTGAIVQSIEEIPDRAIDAGSRVIDQGTTILRRGIDTGVDLIDGFVPFLGN